VIVAYPKLLTWSPTWDPKSGPNTASRSTSARRIPNPATDSHTPAHREYGYPSPFFSKDRGRL
jgi:hypothetical protein